MDLSQNYSLPLAVVGIIFIAYYSINLLIKLLRVIRSFLFPQLFEINLRELGEWAVVTGATDGIGKAYAKLLAQKGLNVVLISRTQSKLDETAKEISRSANVNIKTISVDFSGDLDIYTKIESELGEIDIGLLVNNVGMSAEYPEYFHLMENRDSNYEKIIRINIYSVTFMTSLVLPKMLEKGRGAIVNIGSAARFSYPLGTVYGATKAYVHSFSENLDIEYRKKGIIVQSVFPHTVSTKMSKVRKSSFFCPTPDSYAKAALGTLGLETETTGYFSHWLEGLLAHELLPRWLLTQLLMNINTATRARALKKRNSKSE